MMRVDFDAAVVFCPIDPELGASYDLIKALSGGVVWATVYRGARLLRARSGRRANITGRLPSFCHPIRRMADSGFVRSCTPATRFP